MFISNEDDPAFLYEGLARAAFDNCSKRGDPYKYAAQEVYGNFVDEIKLRGRRALAAVIAKVIIDHKSNQQALKVLIKLDDEIWELKTQDEVIDWLEELRKEMENLDYN